MIGIAAGKLTGEEMAAGLSEALGEPVTYNPSEIRRYDGRMKTNLPILLLAFALGLGCGNGAERGHGRGGGTMDDGMMGDGMMGDGMMGESMDDMPDWMMSGEMGMDGDMMRDMHVIHELLRGHEGIDRQVEDIPGGVLTVTTSSDPELARSIRRHVRQMKERVEEGRAIRHMDPVFREIFANNTKIEMSIEDVPGGVRVVETSEDPQVTLLIRQHARRAVSEFVDEGMSRAMQPTPLPDGYRASP